MGDGAMCHECRKYNCVCPPSQRAQDAIQIDEAYKQVEKSLAKVGRLLRTTEAGKFIWADNHKTAVSGLKAMIKQLRKTVPDYN